jgi:hypothetical protein
LRGNVERASQEAIAPIEGASIANSMYKRVFKRHWEEGGKEQLVVAQIATVECVGLQEGSMTLGS